MLIFAPSFYLLSLVDCQRTEMNKKAGQRHASRVSGLAAAVAVDKNEIVMTDAVLTTPECFIATMSFGDANQPCHVTNSGTATRSCSFWITCLQLVPEPRYCRTLSLKETTATEHTIMFSQYLHSAPSQI